MGKAVATLAIALSLPLAAIALIIEAPATASAASRPAATSSPQAERPAKKKEKAKPKVKAAKAKATKAKKKKPTPSIEAMIKSHFGKRADEALAVARCESKLQPRALSRSGARGIFQIMPVHSWRIAHVNGKDLWDPKTNIMVAKHLFKDEGWRPWSCARIVGLR